MFEDSIVFCNKSYGFHKEDYGDYIYAGYIKRGRRNGYGSLTKKNHFIMRCLWDNGVPCGFTVIEYINNVDGISQYMGEINDLLEYQGQGRIQYTNGNYYEGEFENGKYNGNGLLCMNGTKYTGLFLDGVLTHSMTIEL